MGKFLFIASMAFIAWSLMSVLFWTYEEATYWVLLSVALSLLASNLKLAEKDKPDQPSN
jgi:uncharacterized ion transporter superfamily protein YfcC